jgi:type I restriction enzyme S subunit
MDTKKLRQKILDLAIRGKLVPQDPNDEPASLLLQRIHEEKERLIKEGKIKRSKTTATATIQKAPSGWICCRFDEICSKFSTGPFGSMVHKSDYVSQNGTPIVNPMNIVDGAIVANSLMMVSNEKAQELERYRLSKDDILIARRGDLSKCAIVTDQAVGWLCGTGSFFLHAPFVEPRYIELFYLSEYVQTILKRECVGATMDNLNQSVLGSIPFLLPPLAEQQRIVNEVERWFAVIDALENNEGDLLKAIDQAKSKILDLAIHGKLVPQDPNDEPAIELLKRINPKFEACDNELDTNQLPDSWCWVNGIDIFEPMKSTQPHGDTFKYIDIDAIDNKRNIITSIKVLASQNAPSRASRYTEKGNILFSMVRPYLRNIAMVPENNCIASTGFYVCREKEFLLSHYCLFMMLSDYVVNGLNAFMKGDNSPSINKSHIESFKFPLPPYQEQLRIVAKIEELFGILDGIKEALEA